ncbi:MAG: hypothetical protein ACUVV0_14715 [Anaerolineae bacterium]
MSILALALLLAGLSLIADRPAGARPPAATPALPTISFRAEPDTIRPGDFSTLRWRISNAYYAELWNPEAGTGHWIPVSNTAGEMQVFPQVTTDYILRASNSAGEREQVVTVRVLVPPEILFFSADRNQINLGESVILNWEVEDADAVRLNGRVVTGTRAEVRPTQTTLYTLVAENAGGTATSALTVVVNLPPTIASFTADRQAIFDGEKARLSWQVMDASEVFLDGKPVAAQGTKEVMPTQTRNYTLLARNAYGESQNILTIVVNPGPPTILEFNASRDAITEGESVILTWKVSNAEGGVYLNGEDVSAFYLKSVSPSKTQSYTLLVRNVLGQEAQKALTVAVNPRLPSIRRFEADRQVISQGETANLSWEIEGAERGRLYPEGKEVLPNAMLSVSPDSTCIYRLEACNAAGCASAELTLEVQPSEGKCEPAPFPAVDLYAATFGEIDARPLVQPAYKAIQAWGEIKKEKVYLWENKPAGFAQCRLSGDLVFVAVGRGWPEGIVFGGGGTALVSGGDDRPDEGFFSLGRADILLADMRLAVFLGRGTGLKPEETSSLLGTCREKSVQTAIGFAASRHGPTQSLLWSEAFWELLGQGLTVKDAALLAAREAERFSFWPDGLNEDAVIVSGWARNRPLFTK